MLDVESLTWIKVPLASLPVEKDIRIDLGPLLLEGSLAALREG